MPTVKLMDGGHAEPRRVFRKIEIKNELAVSRQT